jgi:hypothetical protein
MSALQDGHGFTTLRSRRGRPALVARSSMSPLPCNRANWLLTAQWERSTRAQQHLRNRYGVLEQVEDICPYECTWAP